MLKVDEISRRFGARLALDRVSFDVRLGRLTGFVGRNGAGKTTTMRIILGVLQPDSGEIHLNGKPLDRSRRARFGYMPEERGLYPKMRVAEQLTYLGQLHGMSTRAARDSTRALLGDLGIDEYANHALEKLSLGNQQRVQIAASLVHGPIALVLDEPFSGLDPVAVRTGAEVLRQYASVGVPVLFSSHQLDVVDQLCDDLAVIEGGRIVTTGSKEQIRQTHAGNRYILTVSDAVSDVEVPWPNGVRVVGRDGGSTYFQAETDDAASRMLAVAVAHIGSSRVRAFGRAEVPLSEVLAKAIKK